MKLTPIINRLVSQVNSFGDRVRGAAEYERVRRRSEQLLTTHAFVLINDETAFHHSDFTGPTPDLIESFAVIIALDNRADATGTAAIDAVDDIKTELDTDLVGWQPDANHSPIRLESGALVSQDHNTLWYGFVFSTVEWGHHVFTGEMTARYLASDVTDTSGVRTALVNKVIADAPGGKVWSAVVSNSLFGNQELLVIDQFKFGVWIAPAGVPSVDGSEFGRSNNDPRVYVVHFQFAFWQNIAGASTDNNALRVIGNALDVLQALDYLTDASASIRMVLDPFRLEFPGDVRRTA